MSRADTSPCILWPGRVSTKGIPLIQVGGSGGYRHKGGVRWRSARQVIYGEHWGPTGGLPVGTTCGRSTCVQPDHLTLIRNQSTGCPNGHKWTPQTTRWRVRRDKGEVTPTRDCLVCKRVSEGKRRRNTVQERSYR